MKSIILKTIVLSLVASSPLKVAAEPNSNDPCTSLAECAELKLRVDKKAAGLWSTQAPLWNDAVLSHETTWNFEEANKYCADMNRRLPTPREFAELGTLLGAVGIKESKYPGSLYKSPEQVQEWSELSPLGYSPIYKSNDKGEVIIDFYYKHEGYSPYSYLKEYRRFWTSRIHPIFSEPKRVLAYTFWGSSQVLGGFATDNVREFATTTTWCIK